MENLVKQCSQLCENILSNREAIYKIMIAYQPRKVVDYEIDRAIFTLKTIHEKNLYFVDSVPTISVFLSSNLPLYSLILFGIVPSFLANRIYIKPNLEMREKKIIDKLVKQLAIDKIFKNISIVTADTNKFIDKCVPQSDVVIFTGYNKNRDKILSLIKPECLLIYNGSGHNPIVVSHDAKVDQAVYDACFTKFFNSGQDCAGPDAILVHNSIYDAFLGQYLNEVKKLKIGNYENPEVDVGPIYRKSELKKFLNILCTVKPGEIIMGGRIDVKEKIVEPTVIARDLIDGGNFAEMFGPISFIHRYTDDEQLKLYFNDAHGAYKRNKMYVSLYGTSSYLSKQNDQFLTEKNDGIGIILKDKSIHNYERGDRPYGGYSIGASAVFVKDIGGTIQSLAMPIYIPEIISLHLKRKIFSKKLITTVDKEKKIYLDIENSFKFKVKEIFQENLIFGFIFGSIAKRTAKFWTNKSSDLDTFIYLKEHNPDQEVSFKKWLVKFQWECGLSPDFDYKTEIVTSQELEDSIGYLAGRSLDLNYNSEKKFDAMIWLAALADKKLAVVGNKKQLSILTKNTNKELKRLTEIFMKSLESSPIINRKMLLNSNPNPTFYKIDILSYINFLYRKKDYLSIVVKFIPFGGKKIDFNQDDQYYSLVPYYEKETKRNTPV